MDLTDLAIFRTVVEAGGITRAAEKLHRVQSNITTRIRLLEEDLGTQLFLRQGKKLHVSPAGRILLDYANRLLALAEETRDAVQDHVPRGLLRLGAMESTAAVRLPVPLSLYHRRFPAVSLELQTGNSEQLVSLVLAGALDAALVAEPIATAPFDLLPIYDEELVIAAAARHPSIRAPGSGAPATILAFESGCPHRKRLEDWFARAGHRPARIVEMSSYHAMLGCIAAGMGMALLPRAVLDTFPEKGHVSIHPLPPGYNYARTLLIWRKGLHSPKIAALAKILIETKPVTMARRQRRAGKA
nr:LysR family transcriptional regulator [uncultured Dongia sp.]